MAQFGSLLQWAIRFFLIKFTVLGFEMTFLDVFIWTLFATIVIPALIHFFE